MNAIPYTSRMISFLRHMYHIVQDMVLVHFHADKVLETTLKYCPLSFPEGIQNAFT
jgi:hypothetical protein